MNINTFKELIEQTRSTRRFLPNISIKNEELSSIIDLVRQAPSPKNMQPLKYITVTQKEYVEKLAQTCKWAAHLSQWNQSKEEQPSAFIIVLNDTTIDGFEMLDCGISLQTIMLALKIKGYASCPLASIDKEVCKEIFNHEDHLKPILGIAIGKEDETIHIVDVEEDTNYYRNDKDEHCVPKRALNDVLVGQF